MRCMRIFFFTVAIWFLDPLARVGVGTKSYLAGPPNGPPIFFPL